MDNDDADEADQDVPDPLETLIKGLLDGSSKPNQAFKSLMAKWRNGELGVDLPSPGDMRQQEQRAARPARRPGTARAQPSTTGTGNSLPRSAPKRDATLAMVVAYSNGATPAEIAATHGVPVQTVREVLQDAGIVLRERKTALSPEVRAEVRARHTAGESAREIGRQLGVSHTTISRFLHSLEADTTSDDPTSPPRTALTDRRGPVASGITRAAASLNEDSVQRLVQEYENGATVSDLAATYGVHRATVRTKLRENDVSPRERAPQHEHAEEFA